MALSDEGELSVSPVRAPLAGVIGEVVPVPLGLLEQDAAPSYLVDDDFRILHDLAGRTELLPGLTWYPLPPSAGALFRALLGTGRARWGDPEGAVLYPAGPVVATVRWLLRDDGSQSLGFDLSASACAPDTRQLPLLPPWVVEPDSGACRQVKPVAEASEVALLLGRGWLEPEAARVVARMIRQRRLDLPEPICLDVERLQPADPLPCVTFRNVEVGSAGRFVTLPAVELSFLYGSLRLAWDAEGGSRLVSNPSPIDRGRVMVAQRRLAFEEARLTEVEALGLAALSAGKDLDYLPGTGGLLIPVRRDRLTESWVAVQRGIRALARKGWRVDQTADLVLDLIDPERWICRLQQDREGLFRLDLRARSGNGEWSLLEPLADWARQATPLRLQTIMDDPDRAPELILPLDQRRIVALPAWRARAALTCLVELADPDLKLTSGQLVLGRGRLAELGGLDQAWGLTGPEDLAFTARRLNTLDHIAPASPPRGLEAELRQYQSLGLGWLQFLREAGFGGILADDMGLGKTIQTLAFVLSEKEAGRLDRPALVVAPTSLMFNWRAEARRFAPSLKTLLLHGPARRGEFQWIEDYDLVLTTYPLLARDLDWLKQERWHLLILDEAQAIKNARTRVSRAARQLDARHRLCLTGTPLENNLSELWSQFDFLMPGLLGTDKAFRAHFRQPIEKAGNAERMAQLSRRIRPFFLRRSKADVAPELPPKTEILRSVPLHGSQLKLYEAVRVDMQERVRRAMQFDGPERGRIVVLDALLKLRQICCDPRLLDPEAAIGASGSAKLSLLMDLVPEMVVEGRRILLFSQFVRMLEIIERELAQHGIPYLKLTGQTRDRQKIVEAFQAGQAPVFLISLRAGGVGLNLTAADTVIHYDPWWNPAVEDQATDRAHRIGQDQKVFVYRLLTEGTIEDKIQQLQASKRELIDGMLGGGGALDLAPEDLAALFGPG